MLKKILKIAEVTAQRTSRRILFSVCDEFILDLGPQSGLEALKYKLFTIRYKLVSDITTLYNLSCKESFKKDIAIMFCYSWLMLPLSNKVSLKSLWWEMNR